MKKLLFKLFVLCISISTYGQNLIVNPEAELDPISNGWIAVSGAWASASEITPQKGTFHFAAGASEGISELYQDIDVTSLSSDIDAGNITFSFSGYIATWNGIDECRIIVEYRDALNTVLSTYDTGLQVPTSWTKFTDSRVAIANTRNIRVRLFSTRNQGTDSDGYIDDLELYAISNPSASNVFPLYGNVGIGIDSPDAKLAVNGNIHTKEVKVDMMNWPDYVFEESYKLKSLKEIELYISKYGHLPNIPKASLVKKEGIQLGEMNAKLLEKIEELTLYAIDQEYKIDKIEQSRDSLEQRIKKLEGFVERLERMINKYHRTKVK